MDNQHKQISGYRDLTQAEIDAVNEIKRREIELGEFWRDVSALPDIDRRWLAVAKTHFEEGFSAFVRSVARPEPRF
jgi:hypothetical protein